MQPYPQDINKTLESIYESLRVITRLRNEDIVDRNTFPSIFMMGRKVGKVPTSPTDIAATDRVGDFNYDVNNYYLLVQNGSTVEWKIQPFNGVGIYGEMYATNTSQTVTVSSASVAYEITTGLSGGINKLFTFGGGHYLKAQASGIYLLNWSLAIQTASAGQEIEGGYMINGVAQVKGTSHTEVAVANKSMAVSASALVTLSVDEEVSLFVRNHSAATNITWEHATATLVRVDS